MRSPQAQQRLIANELQHHAAVSGSRHVCTLIGVIDDHQVRYAVQELCTGGTLQATLRSSAARMPHKSCMRIARGLLHALAECADKGIVHNDVKPDNLMLLDGEVKLTDFGSSCTFGKRCQFATPAYAAPEVARLGLCSTQSDSWSAGILLHQLLAHAPVPVTEFPSGTPLEARDLVAALTRLNPEDRLHPYEALGHPYFSMGA
ncbi:kinase-like domain-containing protein [Scenedesmus sp. NREL 46B-D3]|nr:kinase-like domain-containing protein [Scenedesmus sp. NREL 46B-D3]